jgi:hypothetical protein
VIYAGQYAILRLKLKQDETNDHKTSQNHPGTADLCPGLIINNAGIIHAKVSRGWLTGFYF